MSRSIWATSAIEFKDLPTSQDLFRETETRIKKPPRTTHASSANRASSFAGLLTAVASSSMRPSDASLATRTLYCARVSALPLASPIASPSASATSRASSAAARAAKRTLRSAFSSMLMPAHMASTQSSS